MARKRTLNYRDFRGDFDESEEGRRKKDEEEEGDETEEEDEDEDEDEASDEEGGDEEKDEEASDEEGDEEAPPKKKVKEKEKKKPAKAPRAKKPRASKIIRMRVVWGVFNNSNQRVASFDYARKHEAEEHAAKLMTDKKQTFFIQPVKEPMEPAK
jgi:hypothetical protein